MALGCPDGLRAIAGGVANDTASRKLPHGFTGNGRSACRKFVFCQQRRNEFKNGVVKGEGLRRYWAVLACRSRSCAAQVLSIGGRADINKSLCGCQRFWGTLIPPIRAICWGDRDGHQRSQARFRSRCEAQRAVSPGPASG